MQGSREAVCSDIAGGRVGGFPEPERAVWGAPEALRVLHGKSSHDMIINKYMKKNTQIWKIPSHDTIGSDIQCIRVNHCS